MGLTQQQLNAGIDALAALDPNFARALSNAGYPEPRIRAPGYTTLLRTIVGQQVSVAAATSIWNKLEAQFGEGCPAEVVAAADFDTLRACGLSGQKQGYAKSLAQLILDGELEIRRAPRRRRGSDRAARAGQGHRPLVGRNLPAVCRGAPRHLARGRPGGTGSRRAASSSWARAPARNRRATSPKRGARIAGLPRHLQLALLQYGCDLKVCAITPHFVIPAKAGTQRRRSMRRKLRPDRRTCSHRAATARSTSALHRISVQRIHQHREGCVPGFTREYGVKMLVWFEQHSLRWKLGDPAREADQEMEPGVEA
jgi:hypothetical protein